MPKVIVTGAFGYTGRFIAQELLSQGVEVETLSNSVGRPDPFNGQVKQHRFSFNDQALLVNILSGADYLFNTYWVRFNHDNFTFREAINNTEKLFAAAKKANIKKIIHFSVSNCEKASELEYFSGKLKIDNMLIASGIKYTILRPALIVGTGDILVNNIAWCLRNFPFIALFGDGSYKITPIDAKELVQIAINRAQVNVNEVLSPRGPETFTYKDFVNLIGAKIGYKKSIIPLSPERALFFGQIINYMVKDTVITRDEIEGLMQNLLYIQDKPIGKLKFSDWLEENKDSLGLHYSSELAKRVYKSYE